VRAARTAKILVGIGILLAMQGNTQRNQSPGIFLGILAMTRYSGEVAGYDLEDVGGNLAWLPTSSAEAMKLQILLRLVD
jgi:hypothetical protein